MNNIISLLGLCSVFITVNCHFKLFKMERSERVEIREYEMDKQPRELFLGNNGQRGQFANCGSTEKKFSVEWEPKVLNTQGVATIYWDLVAPYDIESGNAHLDVYLPDIPKDPIFSLDQKGTCADIKKNVPTLNCPIKKDDEIKGQITASDLTRLPTGTYSIMLKVTNSKNELFLCGNASIELTP